LLITDRPRHCVLPPATAAIVPAAGTRRSDTSPTPTE
jgi:hypothetical protein